jgi:hypothetical protein
VRVGDLVSNGWFPRLGIYLVLEVHEEPNEAPTFLALDPIKCTTRKFTQDLYRVMVSYEQPG